VTTDPEHRYWDLYLQHLSVFLCVYCYNKMLPVTTFPHLHPPPPPPPTRKLIMDNPFVDVSNWITTYLAHSCILFYFDKGRQKIEWYLYP
jgi:hypothetical protein